MTTTKSDTKNCKELLKLRKEGDKLNAKFKDEKVGITNKENRRLRTIGKKVKALKNKIHPCK